MLQSCLVACYRDVSAQCQSPRCLIERTCNAILIGEVENIFTGLIVTRNLDNGSGQGAGRVIA